MNRKELFNHPKEGKGYGFVRKNKSVKGLASGIALAGSIVTFGVNNQASADEVVLTDNPATNMIEAQDIPTDVALENQLNEGSIEGSLESGIEDSGLDQAIQNATEVGVVIEETAEVTYDNLSEAQADLDNQETKVVEATETQKEVDATRAEGVKQAETAGVEIKVTNPVTYKNDNASALKDASEQRGNLDTAQEAQREIDANLPGAQNSAKQAGINLSVETTKSYLDTRKALEDLSNQLVILQESATKKRELDSALALATNKAHQEALELNYTGATTVKSLDEYMNLVNKDVQNIETAIEVQNEVRLLLNESIAKAEASGLKYTLNQNTFGDSASALENVNKIIATVDEAINRKSTNESNYEQDLSNWERQKATIEAENAQKQANYEAELSDIQSKNDAINASNKEVMESVGLTWTGNYSDDAAAVDKWNAENAGTKTTDGGQSGLTATDSTSYSAVSGATKVSASDAGGVNGNLGREASIATQGFSGDQNTDFDTNNIFKIDSSTTPAVIKVTGTSHGDVTLTFSNINADYWGSAKGGTGQVYVALYDSGDGGIAWSLFDLANTTSTGGGAGEASSGSGTVGVSGRMPVYIHSYDVRVTTDADDLTVFTINDVDAGQTITIDTSGAEVEVGKNISRSGNTFTSTSGEVTQASQGKLDSNGVGLTYSDPRRIDTSFSHTTPAQRTSIVGGVFGVSSLRSVTTVVEPIAIQNTLELPNPISATTIPPRPEEPEQVEIQISPMWVSVDFGHYDLELETHNIQVQAETHDVIIATDVHDVNVELKPGNVKEVVNTENTSIDKETVPKGSDVKWVLSNESLKAGRPYTVTYSMSDALPDGYVLNVRETQSANANWDVAYDASTHTVVLTARSAVLDTLNANLAQSVSVPAVSLIGSVTNDAATYVNTFITTVTTAETVIRDDNGKLIPNGDTNTYTVTSNTVRVYTPGSDYRTYNGNVVVRYYDTDGRTIAPNAVDTEDGEVGSSYDTTDNRPETIAFEGQLYKRTPKIVGDELGKVIEGTIYVDYYYELVPMEENKGAVVVHYINEDGQTIAVDVVDTPETAVGTDYDTTDNKPVTITTPDGIEYELVPAKTIGEETGQVVEGVTEVTYVYKRLTPYPETPTPNDNVIKPEKNNYNAEGEDINDTVMAHGFTNYYKAEWDLDQYKDITSTLDSIQKGFGYIDAYQKNALTPLTEEFSIVTVTGDIVSGLTMVTFEDVSSLSDELQSFVKDSGVDVSDTSRGYILWVADNPEAFFDTYVSTGTDIFFNMPMTVKDDFEGDYTNYTYQIDFGNGYYSNIVENTVVVPEPVKENFNKDGVNIDGMEVLAGSVNYYRITWDLDQYKGIKASEKERAKGFYMVDDYPEEAVDILADQIRFYYLDENEKEVAVTGISVQQYASIKDAPKEIQDYLAEIGYEPKGAFQVFVPDNMETFYTDFVQKGINIYIVDPMQVKAEMAKTGGQYENQAIQIDFGKATLADLVVNNVPKFEAVKDVLVDGQSVNDGVIALGEVFSYSLTGAYIPANRSDAIWQYDFVDDYDQVHDEYQGEYKVTAEVDFELRFKDEEGNTTETVKIKAGDDLTKYTWFKHDTENGIIEIGFTEEFYNALDNDQAFQATASILMKRIATGDVYNKFSNWVNGVEVISNTVHTFTPEPVVPVEPQEPQASVEPQDPETPEHTLPNTGDAGSMLGIVTGLFSLGLGALGFKRKKD